MNATRNVRLEAPYDRPPPTILRFPSPTKFWFPNGREFNTPVRPFPSSEVQHLGKGGKGGRSRNDQRSDALNPNNPSSKAASDNRANQLNPNSPAYKSTRAPASDKDEE